MNYEYSIYMNEWCGWQLWRGQAGGFRHTQLVRRLLPESVRMMRRRGMLRRVGLSSALQVTMPNPARSGLSADAQGSDCAKGAKDG